MAKKLKGFKIKKPKVKKYAKKAMGLAGAAIGLTAVSRAMSYI